MDIVDKLRKYGSGIESAAADEIERLRKERDDLREKLRVAEEAFEQAKIELIETGTCADTLDEALAKIREEKK